MTALLSGLIILPALAAVALVLFVRSSSGALRMSQIVTAIAMVCALLLLPFGTQDLQLQFGWLPSFGDWSLTVGGVGLYALLITVACALLTRFAASDEPASPTAEAVYLIALAASNAAFLSGHFLARYVALEVVALCVAIATLVALHHELGARAAGFVYLLFRIGDVGLLAAILLLFQATGTLAIGDTLQIGMSLIGPRSVWIAVALILSIWVKAGAWPFHSWLRVGAALGLRSRSWLYGVLMPSLGFYLLYRVAPLLTASISRSLIVSLGLGVAVVATLVVVRGQEVGRVLLYGNTAVAGLALASVGGGVTAGVVGLLIVTAPIRLWLWRREDTQTLQPAFLAEGRVIARDVSLDAGEGEVFRHKPVKTAERWGGDGLVSLVGNGVVSIGRWFSALHTGHLRAGLAWILVSLTVALAVVWLVL